MHWENGGLVGLMEMIFSTFIVCTNIILGFYLAQISLVMCLANMIVGFYLVGRVSADGRMFGAALLHSFFLSLVLYLIRAFFAARIAHVLMILYSFFIYMSGRNEDMILLFHILTLMPLFMGRF